MSRRPTLVLLYAPDPSVHPGALRLPIPREAALIVGRNPDADMTLPDARASRKHAEIRWDGERVTVKDLSQNGTSVDGARFEAGEVVDGDVVRFGDSFVILRFAPETDEPEVDEALTKEVNGISPAMRAVRRTIGEAAKTPAAVRVGGPPGAAKRAVARVIHRWSERDGDFVTIDDTAHVNIEDIEATLEKAAMGTAYISNVSALSERVRAAIRDPGSARIIVGTRSKFESEDLFGHEIDIPPLRSRREDILPYVLRTVARPPVDLEPELVAGLLRHRWPYNVRELSKVARALAERGADERVLELGLIRHDLAFIGGAADATLPATEFRVPEEE